MVHCCTHPRCVICLGLAFAFLLESGIAKAHGLDLDDPPAAAFQFGSAGPTGPSSDSAHMAFNLKFLPPSSFAISNTITDEEHEAILPGPRGQPTNA